MEEIGIEIEIESGLESDKQTMLQFSLYDKVDKVILHRDQRLTFYLLSGLLGSVSCSEPPI